MVDIKNLMCDGMFPDCVHSLRIQEGLVPFVIKDVDHEFMLHRFGNPVLRLPVQLISRENF